MGFLIGLMLGGAIIFIFMAAVNASHDYCSCEYKCCEKKEGKCD